MPNLEVLMLMKKVFTFFVYEWGENKTKSWKVIGGKFSRMCIKNSKLDKKLCRNGRLGLNLKILGLESGHLVSNFGF